MLLDTRVRRAARAYPPLDQVVGPAIELAAGLLLVRGASAKLPRL
jgi:hypothetical protein